MTKIAPSHLLANRAVAAVTSVLACVGALAEPIKNDYGEDLLVQTQLDGAADTFRIFIQVKGTTLKASASQEHSFRVDVAHLRRWVGHLEPILLCVFDDATQEIYALDPRARFSLWELSMTTKKTIAIKISDRDRFTAKTARQYIWQSRIAHLSLMLASAESHDFHLRSVEIPRTARQAITREMQMIAFDFVRSIGLVRDAEVNAKFVSAMQKLPVMFGPEAKEPPLGVRFDNLKEAVMFNLLGHVHDVCGVGLPSNFLEHGTEMAGHFLRAFHPEEWAQIKGGFRDDQWVPYNARPPRAKARRTR